MENSQKNSLILASGSPRRRELLEEAGVSFEVIVPEVNEESLPEELPKDMVLRLSRTKADAIASKHPGRFVLAADTIAVTKEDSILGKPKDSHDAEEMLRGLSGREHFVLSGFTLLNLENAICISRAIETAVLMRELSLEEIKTYVASGEPLDMAGSYAIQGLGGALVKSYEGSYSNVVGLPMKAVLDELKKCGLWNGNPSDFD